MYLEAAEVFKYSITWRSYKMLKRLQHPSRSLSNLVAAADPLFLMITEPGYTVHFPKRQDFFVCAL